MASSRGRSTAGAPPTNPYRPPDWGRRIPQHVEGKNETDENGISLCMHGGGKTLNNPWLARFVYNAATSLNITARRPVDSSLLPTASETSTHYIGTMAGHGRGHRPAIQNRPAARRVKLTVNHAMYCRPPPRRKGPSITSSGREVIRGAAASLPLDKGLVRVHACVHVHASLPLDAEGLVCVHACVHVHASLPLDQGLVRGALITCCTLSWRTPKRASGTNIHAYISDAYACTHVCILATYMHT